MWNPYPFPADSRAWSVESLTPTYPLPPPQGTAELSRGARGRGVRGRQPDSPGWTPSLASPSQHGTKRGHLPGFLLVTEYCGFVSHPQTCLSKPKLPRGVNGVGGHSRLRSHGGVEGLCEVQEGAVSWTPCNARASIGLHSNPHWISMHIVGS